MAAVASALLLTGPPAVAAKKKKPVNPCALVTLDELETIFKQTFRDGIQESGGACLLRRKNVEEPDIVVTILAKRHGSVKRAKAAFDEESSVTTELSGEVEKLPNIGDDAFGTVLIGAQLVSLRLGRIITDIRVDQNDDPDATFREQALALGTVVVTHLATG